MMAHARDPVVPPSQVRSRRPGRPRARSCSAAWPRSPDDRYPDVKALGEALAACASAADWDTEKAEAMVGRQSWRIGISPAFDGTSPFCSSRCCYRFLIWSTESIAARASLIG